MTRLFVAFFAFAAALVSFSGVSLAANAVDPIDGSLDAAKAVYDAFAGGHWALGAALSLVVGVALMRKYLGSSWQWLHTDAGSAATVLAGSFGASLASSLAGGGPLTLSLAWSAACIAFAAAGGYAMLKKLVVIPLAPKLPAWLQKPVLWLFEHQSDPGVQMRDHRGDGNTPTVPSAH